MKNAHFFFLAFIFAIISGCSKNSDNPTSNYTVTGITDITVPQYADTTVNVVYHVVFPGGLYEPVTLSITGLPPGVTVSPASVSDSSSFSMQFTYHIRMTAAASFPVTVSLFSGSFGLKTFTFNIVITRGVPFSYSVSSPVDVSIPLYADTILRIPVKTTYNAGIKETVTIYADGLPAGVTVSPATAAGTPTFTDTFAFHVIANTTGTLPVTLHTTSSQGTMQTSFNINVVAGSDCSIPLTGHYSGNTICTSYTGAGTGVNPAQVYLNGTNQLLIEVPFAYIITDLNCSNGTLNTEPTTSGSYTIPVGTGTFNANTIIVNYTLTGAINSNCTTTLTR